MKISYLRPVKFQPGRLEVLASTAYTSHVIGILRKYRHYFSDAVCLRVLRRSLGDHLTAAVARTVREELFRYGCHVLQKEGAWSAVRDFQVRAEKACSSRSWQSCLVRAEKRLLVAIVPEF